ncbi:Ov3 [Ovine gammaherpesvirus 2]|uniref:Ov3 n=1 Tax=Ovine gammaherpesvirus 2 TaxID=10398 RepID=A1BLZ4_9GAMA|nr:Ov3 [Ovine gammaherpesvirus 2]
MTFFRAILQGCILYNFLIPIESCVQPPHPTVERGLRINFTEEEPHTVLFKPPHEPVVWVGAKDKVYVFDFSTQPNGTRQEIQIMSRQVPHMPAPTGENFITLIHQQPNNRLVCGTNSGQPGCWLVSNDSASFMGSGRGYAPFTPTDGDLVLFDEAEVYSTINTYPPLSKKSRKFRRIKGEEELYTSDTAMLDPFFLGDKVYVTQPSYDDKIYTFFQENAVSSNTQTYPTVARVAQVCRNDEGGESSLSAYKWTTFLKATLLCGDLKLGKVYPKLQDVFFSVEHNNQQAQPVVYGLFLNPWNFSAICAYSLQDIAKVFRTSKLKKYYGPLPNPRPGVCMPTGKRVPTSTFQVADRYPEVSAPVKPSNPSQTPLLESEQQYEKLRVQSLSETGSDIGKLLYLSTPEGKIHKISVFTANSTSVTLEIQPFLRAAAIQGMLLDIQAQKLYVNSKWEISEVPLE